jgi:hypothetical protein
MMDMQTHQQWSALRDLSESQIKKTPLWPTPYEFADAAYANLGDQERAIDRLSYVDKHAGGNPDYADASKILRVLGVPLATATP